MVPNKVFEAPWCHAGQPHDLESGIDVVVAGDNIRELRNQAIGHPAGVAGQTKNEFEERAWQIEIPHLSFRHIRKA